MTADVRLTLLVSLFLTRTVTAPSVFFDIRRGRPLLGQGDVLERFEFRAFLRARNLTCQVGIQSLRYDM